jgi:hypothetical protein
MLSFYTHKSYSSGLNKATVSYDKPFSHSSIYTKLFDLVLAHLVVNIYLYLYVKQSIL